MKTYNVTIEVTGCKTFDVTAEDMDQALEIARENYNNETFIITAEDMDGDAQIMAEEEDGEESTEWTDL